MDASPVCNVHIDLYNYGTQLGRKGQICLLKNSLHYAQVQDNFPSVAISHSILSLIVVSNRRQCTSVLNSPN